MTATEEARQDVLQRHRDNPLFTRLIGNHGFIELEDTWGDEATIINTARISVTNKRIKGTKDFTQREKDLLYHLLKNNHGTPFETVYFRFRFVAPVFVLRQWVKHRISSWNEFSQRYRTPIDAFYIPNQAARCVQSYEVMDAGQAERYCDLMESLYKFYEDEYKVSCGRIEALQSKGRLSGGSGPKDPFKARARELFRNAMPVSTYSDVFWTVNFRSLMNFFGLRLDDHAQYEIRQFAFAAFDMFQTKYPILGETMMRVLDERKQGGEK